MKHYAWIFPIDRMKRDVLLPSELVCPCRELKVKPQRLFGERIWLIAVTPNGTSVLYASIVVKAVYVIKAGIDKGNIVFVSVPTLSFKCISPDKERLNNWVLASWDNIKIGIRAIDKISLERLRAVLKKNDFRSHRFPPANKLSAISLEGFPKNHKIFCRSIFCRVLELFAFGDVERIESISKLSAFAALSFTKATQSGLSINCEKYFRVLDLDLWSTVFEKYASPPSKKSGKHGLEPKFIDTSLRTLVPEKIIARSFLSTPGTATNIFSSMEKTQQAEISHQKIVRDTAIFLTSRGIQPMLSQSVDIAFQHNCKLVLCEVKSAQPSNALAQAKQGLVQLLEYDIAFKEDGYLPKRTLILQSIGDEAIELYIKKLGKHMATDLLFYDDKKEWPQRISGIENFLATI
jgi:hypothetical protein